jgi:tRNA 2-selenouridine synthase
MIISLSQSELYACAQTYPVIDTRSPGEYSKGHVPGAINIPLFSDEQRAIVGTLYIHQGKDAAVSQGLAFVGVKLQELVEQVAAVAAIKPGNKKTVIMYCWRGGMRSRSFANLLSSLGYTVYLLVGGYKAFRAYNREVFARTWKLVVLSGRTGCGKTVILHHFAATHEQVIDLEGLASHKGSVFGSLGQPAQPTQAYFEDMLGWQLQGFDPAQPIWVEDESHSIGLCIVPQQFFESMRSAPRVLVEVPLQQRVEELLVEYGAITAEELLLCIDRLEKYIGSERAQAMRLQVDDHRAIVGEALKYYDKVYDGGLMRKAVGQMTICSVERPFSGKDFDLVMAAGLAIAHNVYQQ